MIIKLTPSMRLCVGDYSLPCNVILRVNDLQDKDFIDKEIIVKGEHINETRAALVKRDEEITIAVPLNNDYDFYSVWIIKPDDECFSLMELFCE